MVAHLVDETRIFWLSSSDRPTPAAITRHGAQARRLAHLIEDPSPAAVFIDCADTDPSVEIEKLRIEDGAEHYLIPVLRELSAEYLVSLIARGTHDAVNDEHLLNPDAIIERAHAQTRLLAYAREGVADFSTLQNHTGGMVSPVFFKDANGLNTGCNPVFERFLGIDRGDILGRTVYDVAPSDLASSITRPTSIL